MKTWNLSDIQNHTANGGENEMVFVRGENGWTDVTFLPATLVVGDKTYIGFEQTKVVELRDATDEERVAFFKKADRACGQVEAQEHRGSTKTLPKGWSIDRNGRTLNQFGLPTKNV